MTLLDILKRRTKNYNKLMENALPPLLRLMKKQISRNHEIKYEPVSILLLPMSYKTIVKHYEKINCKTPPLANMFIK